MRIAVACRAGDDQAGGLEAVLADCLAECPTWDGRGVTDGLVRHQTVVVDNTVEVHGQMSAFKGRGFSHEPFEAILTINDAGTTLVSATLRYGDAERGLGSGEPDVSPHTVTCWAYELETFRTLEQAREALHGRSDGELLDKLRVLEGLPDENSPAWEDDKDALWDAAYVLRALADEVGARMLVAGVGLVLDKMALGDPYELMEGIRFQLEKAVSPEWGVLAKIAVGRLVSERAGTRYWALHVLGVLREASTMADIFKLFDDAEVEVAEQALRSAAMVLQSSPELRAQTIRAMRAVAKRRDVLRDYVPVIIRESIQRWAPATGVLDDPMLETLLPDVLVAVRTDRDAARRLGDELARRLEAILRRNLPTCDEWEGQSSPDGMVEHRVTLGATTLEVRGQMAALTDRGDCIEPIEAIITFDADVTAIESVIIRYGDAQRGLCAVPYGERGIDPLSVTSWMFELRR